MMCKRLMKTGVMLLVLLVMLTASATAVRTTTPREGASDYPIDGRIVIEFR